MLIYGNSINALDIAACGSLLLILYTLLRRYLALRHIPGPFLASWTDFWLHGVLRYGDYNKKAIELDSTYGKLVRYGPNRVLFNDVEAISHVYGTTNVFRKSVSYEVITPLINGRLVPSMLSSRDESDVSAIKRQINHVFSNTAVLDYEHHIDATITSLTEALRAKGPSLDLARWLSYFTFDTICRIGFSDDTDMMARGEDVGDTLEGGRRRFRYWGRWYAIPLVERLLFKNRFVASTGKPELITQIAAKRVQERMEKGGAESGFHDLLDRYFQAQEKAPTLFETRRIIALTLTIVHAGSETTGHTLSIFFFYLLKHPRVYAKLMKEIEDANLSFPPQYNEVVKLKYLEACVKESQRIEPLGKGPQERDVPSQGITILGTFIPAGTVISANKSAMAFDTSIYDPQGKYNVQEYIPERWMDQTAAQVALMDKASLSFGYGKRGCLGIHLAWCELLKAIPGVLMRFDIQLQDKKFQLETEKHLVGLVTGQGLPVVLTERSAEKV